MPTIFLDESLIAIWGFGFRGGDWLAGLMKDPDSPNKYFLNYRFKYFKQGTLPFDPNDERSDHSISFESKDELDEVINKLQPLPQQLKNQTPNASDVFFIDARDKSPDEILEELNKYSMVDSRTQH